MKHYLRNAEDSVESSADSSAELIERQTDGTLRSLIEALLENELATYFTHRLTSSEYTANEGDVCQSCSSPEKQHIRGKG